MSYMCRLAGWTETITQYSAGQLVVVLVALMLLAWLAKQSVSDIVN